MERAALPLNQGGFGTCVGHAFAQALTTAIQMKYGVPCDPTLVVEKVKTLCECWDGHHTARMPEEWNAVHASSRASIEDMVMVMVLLLLLYFGLCHWRLEVSARAAAEAAAQEA